jgi:hypothetical protein
VLRLPPVAELRNGALLALRHEHRVVAEALDAARRIRDVAVEHAAAAQDRAVRRDRNELRHEARATVALVSELAEQLRDRGSTLRRVSRRGDSRTPGERRDLEARVLADDPAVRRQTRPAERRLDERVVVIGVAVLERIVVRIEDVDRPAGEQHLKLARLVRVARSKNGD